MHRVVSRNGRLLVLAGFQKLTNTSPVKIGDSDAYSRVLTLPDTTGSCARGWCAERFSKPGNRSFEYRLSQELTVSGPSLAAQRKRAEPNDSDMAAATGA